MQVPPQPPVIMNGLELEAEEGEEVEVTCRARAGKPPAEIVWQDGSGKEIAKKIKKKKIVEDKVEDVGDTKTQNAVSTVKLKVTKEMQNTNLTCQANHPTHPDNPQVNKEFV